jgi:hypothetical protein
VLQVDTIASHEAAGVQVASLPPIGVHVLAFGARGYGYAAANLAASLKHFSPDVHITAHVGKGAEIPATHRHLFDKITGIAIPDDLKGNPDPGFAKANLADILPQGKSLYIDADSIVLKDIVPFLQELDKLDKPFAMEVIGKGDAKAPPAYFDWVKPTGMLDKYKLPRDTTLYGVQSSWMFFDLPAAGDFADTVAESLEDWTTYELRGHWGWTIPDEVAYSSACSRMGYDPTGPKGAICFGSRNLHNSVEALQQEFHILSLFGQGVGKPMVKPFYFEAYDRILHNVYTSLGMDHAYNWPMIMRDKYVNHTKR